MDFVSNSFERKESKKTKRSSSILYWRVYSPYLPHHSSHNRSKFDRFKRFCCKWNTLIKNFFLRQSSTEKSTHAHAMLSWVYNLLWCDINANRSQSTQQLQYEISMQLNNLQFFHALEKYLSFGQFCEVLNQSSFLSFN